MPRWRGRFLARVDVASPAVEVAAGYEGVRHGQPQQVGESRRRLDDLTGAGWTVVFVTAADLHDAPRVVARLTAALAARGCA